MTLQDFENAFALLTARRFSSNTDLTDAKRTEAEKILALSGIKKLAALLNTLAEELKTIPANERKDYFENARSVLPVLEEETLDRLKKNLRNFLVALSQQDGLTKEQVSQVMGILIQWAKDCEQTIRVEDQDGENSEAFDNSDEEEETSLFATSFRPTPTILAQQRSSFDDLIKETNKAMQKALTSFYEDQQAAVSTRGYDIRKKQPNGSYHYSASLLLLSTSPKKPTPTSKSSSSANQSAANPSPAINAGNGGLFKFEKHTIMPSTPTSSFLSDLFKSSPPADGSLAGPSNGTGSTATKEIVSSFN